MVAGVNISVGGGYTLGSSNPTLNLSASKDKLHSNYDSVKEQSGLFAGKEGFDVKVKEHTQLDGAVIASTADKDKNSLETDTLGWNDIHNKAEFKASHSGGSMSTGGPAGKDLLNNIAGGLLSNANNQDNAQGTTKAAVSEGKWLIRNTDNQTQDITQLSRDTEHANDGSINPIFDKEKEQNRLKQAQLIGEIGNQAMDIIRTQGDIAGLKDAQAKHPNLSVSELRETKEYNHAMERFGTGSDLQKAAQAVTGALTALSGNNLAGALASGASPYLATEIKNRTTNTATGEVDIVANTLAHTLLGAVTAELNNQSAVAGGLGAGGGELAARVIASNLFPNKAISELTESEKQKVSALSQLAAGLAGGISTGNIEGAVTAAQTGKNAVENNFLTKVALEGCALAAPCRGFVAKKVLEYGVKAGITAIVAKEIADNISSDDLDHLITLNMMGNDEITNRYLDYLSGKYATSVQSPDISSQLPGYPIPTPLPPLPGTPIPEQDKDDGKLITPIIDPADQQPNHTSHDDGLSDIDIKNDMGGNQILDKDWRDYILTADNKITRSDHAEIRNREGRPVGQVVNDIENSRPSDILVQDDGRWVILGPKGRVHILEPNGEVVTSMENDRKNTLNRIKDGRWERPNNDKLQEFQDKFSDYIKR